MGSIKFLCCEIKQGEKYSNEWRVPGESKNLQWGEQKKENSVKENSSSKSYVGISLTFCCLLRVAVPELNSKVREVLILGLSSLWLPGVILPKRLIKNVKGGLSGEVPTPLPRTLVTPPSSQTDTTIRHSQFLGCQASAATTEITEWLKTHKCTYQCQNSDKQRRIKPHIIHSWTPSPHLGSKLIISYLPLNPLTLFISLFQKGW